MHRQGRLWLGLVWLASSAALAQNDLRIIRLGNPLISINSYNEANTHFRAFAKELGAALTSANLSPPETLGHAAWAMTFELSVVDLKGVTPTDSDGDGVPDSPTISSDEFYLPTERNFTGPLLLPSIHFRKGFPFSFELGARMAWVDRSQMFAGTVEAKWAVNEGFALLPDIGLRFYATRLFNTRDFDLGAGGFDLGVGKQFAIGGMITLTPYIGWNLVFVGAATRKPTAFNVTDTPAQAAGTFDAQLIGSSVYEEVKMFENSHNRFYVGLRFIGGIIQVAGELSYSALGQIDVTGGPNLRPLPGVGAANVTLGLDF